MGPVMPTTQADYQLIMCCIDPDSTVADLNNALDAGANAEVCLDETQVETTLARDVADPRVRAKFLDTLRLFRETFFVNASNTRPIANAVHLACQFNRGIILGALIKRLPSPTVQRLMASQSTSSSHAQTISFSPLGSLIEYGQRRVTDAAERSLFTLNREREEHRTAASVLLSNGVLPLTDGINTPDHAQTLKHIITSRDDIVLNLFLSFLTHTSRECVGLLPTTVASLPPTASTLIMEYADPTTRGDVEVLVNNNRHLIPLTHALNQYKLVKAAGRSAASQQICLNVLETLIKFRASPHSPISYALPRHDRPVVHSTVVYLSETQISEVYAFIRNSLPSCMGVNPSASTPANASHVAA